MLILESFANPETNWSNFYWEKVGVVEG